jgi:hypothetical protein
VNAASSDLGIDHSMTFVGLVIHDFSPFDFDIVRVQAFFAP